MADETPPTTPCVETCPWCQGRRGGWSAEPGERMWRACDECDALGTLPVIEPRPIVPGKTVRKPKT